MRPTSPRTMARICSLRSNISVPTACRHCFR
jgi:hypothetical protein